MKNKRNRSMRETLIGILFVLILFVFMLVNIIVPDKTKSEMENRMLTTKPKLPQLASVSSDVPVKVMFSKSAP